MDGSVKAGDCTLSYFYHRVRKPLTILPIHGLGDSKDYLKGIMSYPELAAYSVLIPDLVGYGNSQPAPQGFIYTMREQAQVAKILIDSLAIKGDFVLILHSMGGPIGVYLAQLLAPHVRGIVYAEGNIDFNDCFSSNLVITNYTYDEYLRRGFQIDLDTMASRGYQPDFVASQAKAGAVTIYHSSEDLVRVSKADTLLGEIKALAVPVLAVYGEKNKGLWMSERKMGSLFPLVFIPGAGHVMMVDNPDYFYGEVAKFIGSLS